MVSDRFDRFLPLAGVLTGLLFFVGLALMRNDPSSETGPAATFSYWQADHGRHQIVGLLLAPLVAFLLIFFGAGLRRRLAQGGDAGHGSVAFGGALLGSAGFALVGMLEGAMTNAAHEGERTTVYTLNQLHSYDWLAWNAAFAAMLLATGLGARRNGMLPAPLAWATIVIGASLLTPLGFFGFVLVPVWLIVVGLWLGRKDRVARALALAPITAGVVLLAGCGGDGGTAATPTGAAKPAAVESTPAASSDIDRVVTIGADRTLYVRCTGTGSPTVILEGGDEDTSDSYSFAERSIAKVTRTCVYDRANLGQSGPDPGPRGLRELVGDLERLLKAADIPGPYVLVGTSGGGYITAGYAAAHPGQIAGMVFVETGAPFWNPPSYIVEVTDPSNPANIERRDYLQVEKDGWAARKRIGDIPVTILSNRYSAAEISEAFPAERSGMRSNVADQKGWLVLSPRAKQVVVHTGHAVEEQDPELVLDAILDVVRAAQ